MRGKKHERRPSIRLQTGAEVWAALDVSAASRKDIAAVGEPLSILGQLLNRVVISSMRLELFSFRRNFCCANLALSEWKSGSFVSERRRQGSHSYAATRPQGGSGDGSEKIRTYNSRRTVSPITTAA